MYIALGLAWFASFAVYIFDSALQLLGFTFLDVLPHFVKVLHATYSALR
jgi:hypothetical protein